MSRPGVLFGVLLLALSGCASEPEKAENTQEKSASKPKMRITSSSKSTSSSKAAKRKPGQVMFSVKNAKLRDVLVLFEEQAGVQISWRGNERKLSLRLTQPMQWQQALDLVCQFTRTHAVKDYRGRLVLKDGYGGKLASDGSEVEGGGGEGGGGQAQASSGRRSSGSGAGSSSNEGGTPTRYEQTYGSDSDTGAQADRQREIRKALNKR